MENWVAEKEALGLFAHHYETGKLIPEELIERAKEKFIEIQDAFKQIENKMKN